MDKKLVFLHGNVHRDEVQKPKAEQIFDMDGTEKEAHKKIKTTGMETNKAGKHLPRDTGNHGMFQTSV